MPTIPVPPTIATAPMPSRGRTQRTETSPPAHRLSPTVIEPCSLVFDPPLIPKKLRDHREWWQVIKGACWSHPEGPASNIKRRQDHPVVHICWTDAVEYCRWKSKKEKATYRLPTEAEWEFAARGGLDRKPYVWGDELNPDGKWVVNIWQGPFPFSGSRIAQERTLPLVPGAQRANSGVVAFVQNRRTAEVLQVLMLPSCA